MLWDFRDSSNWQLCLQLSPRHDDMHLRFLSILEQDAEPLSAIELALICCWPSRSLFPCEKANRKIDFSFRDQLNIALTCVQRWSRIRFSPFLWYKNNLQQFTVSMASGKTSRLNHILYVARVRWQIFRGDCAAVMNSFMNMAELLIFYSSFTVCTCSFSDVQYTVEHLQDVILCLSRSAVQHLGLSAFCCLNRSC